MAKKQSDGAASEASKRRPQKKAAPKPGAKGRPTKPSKPARSSKPERVAKPARSPRPARRPPERHVQAELPITEIDLEVDAALAADDTELVEDAEILAETSADAGDEPISLNERAVLEAASDAEATDEDTDEDADEEAEDDASDDSEAEGGPPHEDARRDPGHHAPLGGADLLNGVDLAHARNLVPRPVTAPGLPDGVGVDQRDGVVSGVLSTWMSNLTSVPCTLVTVTVTP